MNRLLSHSIISKKYDNDMGMSFHFVIVIILLVTKNNFIKIK